MNRTLTSPNPLDRSASQRRSALRCLPPLALALSFVAACDYTRARTRVQFVEPRYTEIEPTSGTLAAAPVIMGAGRYTGRAFFESALVRELRQAHPNVALVTPAGFRAGIEAAGIEGEYNLAVTGMATTGMVDGDVVRVAGQETGASFILFVVFDEYDKTVTGDEETLADIFFGDDDDDDDDIEYHYALHLLGQLYDARTGELVWQATTVGKAERRTDSSPLRPLISVSLGDLCAHLPFVDATKPAP